VRETPAKPFGLGTFSITGSEPFGGMVLDGHAIALADLGDDKLPRSVLGLLEQWEVNLPKLRNSAARLASDKDLIDHAISVAHLQVHAPLQPRQIFGMGANYRKHVIDLIMADPDMRSGETDAAVSNVARREAAERIMDERANSAQPYCFIKLPTSIAGPYDSLRIPPRASKIDWECELAVIIGRPARHIAAADAALYVAGYAIANDVTARDLVFRRDVKALGTDWLSAKSQPGFTPLGPYLVPAEFVDPYALTIRLSVNGRLMQDELSADMLIRIDRQIEYLSSRVQLLPGDVICTGSPAGNGSYHGVFLQPGDHMVGAITGLGEQRIDCVLDEGETRYFAADD
jgi:2,4-didehydro-3-deoxy-L-rhamnonate hydrolase